MNSLTQVLLDIARTADQERKMINPMNIPALVRELEGQRDELLAVLKALLVAVNPREGVYSTNVEKEVRDAFALIDELGFDKSDELDDSERHEELDPEISGQTGFQE